MSRDRQEWMSDWTVGVRLWFERCGEAILGPGRLELLEAIARCHSISAAARDVGMSYRRAWLLVDSMNRAAGDELVRRQTGGRDGGGATLTERGVTAINVYRELQSRFQHKAGTTRPATMSAHPSVVHVAAAASLENVLHCLLADFAVQQPAISVRAICGATDELTDAILDGLHVDLFLSAANGPLERLKDAGVLAPDGFTQLCSNRLAVISTNQEMANLESPDALRDSEVQSLALADPSCPLGEYTRSYFEALSLWETFRPRALFLDNPRVVLAAVELGQVDVGVVYRSDVQSTPACRILFNSSPRRPRIRYSAALTRRGARSGPTRTLLASLKSAPAHHRLKSFGFLVPRAERSHRKT